MIQQPPKDLLGEQIRVNIDKNVEQIAIRCSVCHDPINLQGQLGNGIDGNVMLFVKPHVCTPSETLSGFPSSIIYKQFPIGSQIYKNGWKDDYKCILCTSSMGSLIARSHVCDASDQIVKF